MDEVFLLAFNGVLIHSIWAKKKIKQNRQENENALYL